MSEPPDDFMDHLGDIELLGGRPETSLLDLVDNLLNQGVVVTGEVVIGLAGIDLLYLRLTALLCAADRILPPADREESPQ